MRVFATLFGFLVLSGCAEYRAKQEASQLNADDAKCQSFGAQKGSAPYIQCMVGQDNRRAADKRATIAGVQQSINSFNPVLPGYEVQPVPNPLANQSSPRQTTCNTMGATTHCTTY